MKTSSTPLPAQRDRLPGHPSELLDFGHNLPEKGEIWVITASISEDDDKERGSSSGKSLVYPPPQMGHFPNGQTG